MDTKTRALLWAKNNFDTLFGWLVCVISGLAILKVFPFWDIFSNTTPTGGDTGAHIWWPAYLRDELLPNFRIAGWAPDWYAGFPAGQFYFPVPALMVVFLDLFMPYNVAFKLVTAIPALLLPWGAYVFGRGIRAARPTPELFAVAMVLLEYFRGDLSGEGAHQAVQFNQRIMGITLASNFAGTFSFTWAVLFALLFLGTFARALDQERRFALPALLFAAVVMSHLVVALFAVVGAILIFAFHMIGDRNKVLGPIVGVVLLGGFFTTLLSRNLVIGLLSTVAIFGSVFAYLYVPLREKIAARTQSLRTLVWPRARVFAIGAAILTVGGLLTAFWSVPLQAFYSETASMRYEKIGNDPNFPGNEIIDLYLFPQYFKWIFIAALAAVLIGLILARRSTLIVFAFTIAFGLVFFVWPEGKAWNLRYLPFYYMGLFFLAACGFGELCRLPGSVTRWVVAERERKRSQSSEIVHADISDHEQLPVPKARMDAATERKLGFWSRGIATALCAILASYGLYRTVAQIGFPWAGGIIPRASDAEAPPARGFVDGWAAWNYAGYEDSAKSYDEYREIITEMDELSPGRAVWEKATEGNADTLNAYGTDFALMVLPYWTDGRIDSLEGLYFESAGSTPYHFLMVAKLARNPSNVVRGYPYKTLADFDEGVKQMQMFGVNYYMAQSPETKQLAGANPDLELIKQIPDRDGRAPLSWNVYRVKNAELVEGLAYEPKVVTDLKSGRESTCFGIELAQGQRDPKLGKWECVAAPWWENPADWDYPLAQSGPKNWQRIRAVDADEITNADQKKLGSVKVTNIKTDNDTISFDVSKVGVPVVVKSSYYPAWRARGAEGPWRLTPNLMVVVPTEKRVTLQFERTSAEWIGILLTGFGIAGVIALAIVPRRIAKRRKSHSSSSSSPSSR